MFRAVAIVAALLTFISCGVIGDDNSDGTSTTESLVSSGDAEAEVDEGESLFGGEDDTDSGRRPSAAEIAAAFGDEAGVELPEEIMICIGEGLHDSDLPNGVLRALVDGREAEVDKENVNDYETTVETIATDCATASL